MNYLIAHQRYDYPFLVTTARKKNIKHSFLFVEDGVCSIRLGKKEYIAQAGQALWIPFGCLNSRTYFPGCRVLTIEVSVRSRETFSTQAGFVTLTPLLKALTELLSVSHFNTDNLEQQKWLEVVHLEFTKLMPRLSDSDITLDKIELLREMDVASMKLALTVREALKLRSSGVKPTRIIEQLFDGNAQQADQLCAAIASQTLT